MSPTDLAKYILYAKKAEKQKYNYSGEDKTQADLSKHKTWFNFTWIDETFYNDHNCQLLNADPEGHVPKFKSDKT